MSASGCGELRWRGACPRGEPHPLRLLSGSRAPEDAGLVSVTLCEDGTSRVSKSAHASQNLHKKTTKSHPTVYHRCGPRWEPHVPSPVAAAAPAARALLPLGLSLTDPHLAPAASKLGAVRVEEHPRRGRGGRRAAALCRRARPWRPAEARLARDSVGTAVVAEVEGEEGACSQAYPHGLGRGERRASLRRPRGEGGRRRGKSRAAGRGGPRRRRRGSAAARRATAATPRRRASLGQRRGAARSAGRGRRRGTCAQLSAWKGRAPHTTARGRRRAERQRRRAWWKEWPLSPVGSSTHSGWPNSLPTKLRYASAASA